MADARITLERFNKVSAVFDILLVLLFLTLGFFGLTFVLPGNIVVNMVVQAVATLVFFVFAVGSLKLAEHLTSLVRLKLEDAVEAEKTEEEKAMPVPVAKKSVSAQAPAPPTLSNTVIKTTKVVLKNPATTVAKRGRPKKEG